MDRFVNKEKLRYSINQLWTKVRATLAQLNAENVFKRKNTFDDTVIIKRETMYVNSPINDDPVTLTGQRKVVGCRSYTSHSNNNNGYVKSVKLRVKDDFNVGSTLRYIYLWAVEKKDSLDQDIILAKIHDGESYLTVKEEAGFGKYVEIFVDRKFENPTYFLVGHSNSISYTKTVAESDDNIYGDLNTVPEDGNSGIVSTHKRFLVQYGLVGESMNLATELERLSNIAGSSVSINTINNVAGISGNVNLGLSSDGANVNLTANNQTIASLPIITDQEIDAIINALT